MTNHESIIHLPEKYEATNFQMWTNQKTVDGLNALIHWLKGYEARGDDHIPGHADLIMHYKSLGLAIAAKIANEEKDAG